MHVFIRELGVVAMQIQTFLLLYFVWFVLGGLLILKTAQPTLHLALNTLHFPGSDDIFVVLSYVGDRRVAWVMGGALLLRKQFRHGATVLLATIGAGLATEFFKYQVFGTVPRPVAIFGTDGPLRLVPVSKITWTTPCPRDTAPSPLP